MLLTPSSTAHSSRCCNTGSFALARASSAGLGTPPVRVHGASHGGGCVPRAGGASGTTPPPPRPPSAACSCHGRGDMPSRRGSGAGRGTERERGTLDTGMYAKHSTFNFARLQAELSRLNYFYVSGIKTPGYGRRDAISALFPATTKIQAFQASKGMIPPAVLFLAWRGATCSSGRVGSAQQWHRLPQLRGGSWSGRPAQLSHHKSALPNLIIAQPMLCMQRLGEVIIHYVVGFQTIPKAGI